MDLRRGGWAQEVDAELHPSQGTVPEGLAGTLYRNGAGNHLSDYGIDGDGLVSAVTFTPGKPVRVRSRYVRTPSYRAALDARDPDGPPVRLAGANAAGGRLRNVLRLPASQANTSVTMIDGRLLALWEGDEPWQLETGTLDTLGRCDLDQALRPAGPLGSRLGRPYSAHPCWDPDTAELWNFGCVYGPRPRLEIYRSRRGGPTEHLRSIRLPRRYMVHDFAMTATHLVFCLGPVIVDLAAVASGRLAPFQAMQWHGDEATRILLIPRAGGPFRVVEADPWFQWHFAGAYDDGDNIVFDLVRFRSWTVMHEAIASMSHLTDPACFPIGRLWRYRVDPAGKVDSHQVHGLPLEWPTIDLRRSTTAHRDVYGAAAGNVSAGLALTAVARYDTERGEADIHDFGPGHLVSEPVFVPRDPGVLDDQGWLIAYENDFTAGSTSIVIFTAHSVADGPVCTLPVPESLGYTFHGQWIQQSTDHLLRTPLT
ncbi:carotenoid oxygenase family protein [Actinocrispum wychmicini]|uniref:Dioxygenase n=1 Tax=Actinocrispum wychmicini TaxID=1213861 RepID=A0A4R2J9L8_9PSEU|nr:carotenoid oxygenase family protein [Actinocrispum wychmicini]TCO56031.1 all-trans-8'-apo-beta-carotenal 15,15'-oxygenase [Actinocrispum wychmicini]